MSAYEAKHVKIRAIKDWVIAVEMDFDEIKTAGGIILRSDDGKEHGVKPRWCRVYKIGPEQKDVKEGQWILVEHGRWSRQMHINDGESEKKIQRIDTNGIMMVSDEPPTAADVVIKDTLL